jgi:hypothetical protein
VIDSKITTELGCQGRQWKFDALIISRPDGAISPIASGPAQQSRTLSDWAELATDSAKEWPRIRGVHMGISRAAIGGWPFREVVTCGLLAILSIANS